MQKSDKKSLLVITHAFPPSGGAGVRRILKTVKYLAKWEWEITVLTANLEGHFDRSYDPSLRYEVPEAVHVISSFTPERWLMPRSSYTRRVTDASIGAWRRLHKRVFKRLGALFAIPDSAIPWLPFAVWHASRIIRWDQIDVILATAPPRSALLIGAVLKQLTGVPLVAEFRDAWVTEPARTRVRIGDNKLRMWIEKQQEAWVVKVADHVVAVTEGVTLDFGTRYPHAADLGKFVTVPNGYDRADFLNLETSDFANLLSDSRFNIVYTGTLGGVRTPRYFLEAVKHLLARRPELRSQLRITLFGHCRPLMDGLQIEDYVQDFQLQEVVKVGGFVSREESLAYQKEADLLLLIVGLIPASESQCYGLSAKVFDYTLAGKPVLTVAEDGATADFVKDAGIGEVVSHYDEAGIIAATERALEGKLHYAPNQSVIDGYDYSTLIHKLESILLSCING